MLHFWMKRRKRRRCRKKRRCGRIAAALEDQFNRQCQFQHQRHCNARHKQVDAIHIATAMIPIVDMIVTVTVAVIIVIEVEEGTMTVIADGTETVIGATIGEVAAVVAERAEPIGDSLLVGEGSVG